VSANRHVANLKKDKRLRVPTDRNDRMTDIYVYRASFSNLVSERNSLWGLLPPWKLSFLSAGRGGAMSVVRYKGESPMNTGIPTHDSSKHTTVHRYDRLLTGHDGPTRSNPQVRPCRGPDVRYKRSPANPGCVQGQYVEGRDSGCCRSVPASQGIL
jgi:hypothetical protein